MLHRAAVSRKLGRRALHFGKNIYANFNLTLVDDTHIYVGDYTMFGPNVVVASAGHPILPSLRVKAYQYNFPVRIGKNCWIGAGVVIVPGVTIGAGTVIGAGSVVTKDIPANRRAVGNPCRVLREISDHDREFYFKDRRIDWSEVCFPLHFHIRRSRLIRIQKTAHGCDLRPNISGSSEDVRSLFFEKYSAVF